MFVVLPAARNLPLRVMLRRRKKKFYALFTRPHHWLSTRILSAFIHFERILRQVKYFVRQQLLPPTPMLKNCNYRLAIMFTLISNDAFRLVFTVHRDTGLRKLVGVNR